MPKKKKYPRKVETLTHHADSRVNIPTAEYEPVLDEKDKNPVRVAYPRPATGHLSEEKDKRVRDLDPQLVWRGKDEQDRADLVVHVPPLYIQEKVQPKALIDDLRRQSEAGQAEAAEQDPGFMPDLFADFNGLPSARACAARCSAFTSIPLTAFALTPIFSGPPPAAMLKMARPNTSPASRSRSRPFATPGAMAFIRI